MADSPRNPETGVVALVPDRWMAMWQPRHHLLSRLAIHMRVAWLDPASEWDETLRQGRVPNRERAVRMEGNLAVMSAPWWLPRVFGLPPLDLALQRHRLRECRGWLRRQGCRRFVLYLWRPEFGWALDEAGFDHRCYHIDDEYSFSDDPQELDPVERRVIASADQVFVHSPVLMREKGNINPRTTLVPNGADYHAFATPRPEPPDLARIPHPRVGYAGWLKPQLDWELLEWLCESRPELQFVFVGPVKPDAEVRQRCERLAERANVHLLGGKPSAELPGYVQHFDAALMPYRVTEYTRRINPLKLYEYLAAGRPIVGPRLDSVLPFADVATLVEGRESWGEAIDHALSPACSRPEAVRARQLAARPYDWNILASTVADRLLDGLRRSTDRAGATRPERGRGPRVRPGVGG